MDSDIGTPRSICFTRKIIFSRISVSRREKNVAGSCALNFGAFHVASLKRYIPKGLASKVVQKGPKGTKMVNISVFDHLGPSGPFRTISDNNEFCGPKWTKYCFLYREEVKNHVIFICFSFLLSDLSHKI